MIADNVHIRISKVLRTGVLFSGVLIFIGWLLQIKPNGNSFKVLEQYSQVGLSETLSLALKDQDLSVLFSYFGLALLLGLPIFRVLMTGIIFLKEKDYLMLGCVFLVLLGLAIGFTLGI